MGEAPKWTKGAQCLSKSPEGVEDLMEEFAWITVKMETVAH